MSKPLEPGIGIEQIDGPAALLRREPWQFTPNLALQALLERTDWTSPQPLQDGFESSAGGLMDALARGQPFRGRLHLGHATDQAGGRLLHADFAPLAAPGDWLVGFVDLSPIEHARARRALTLEHLAHTLDQLNEMISMLDYEETMLFINASYGRFFGTTRNEAVGKKAVEVMRDSYLPTTPPRRELFRTLQPVRYERILLDSVGDQRVLSVLLWPILDAQGRLAKMATITRDITQRQRGMEALRQTLERLDALFEAGIEGILLCEQGLIIDANPIACRHIGLGRHQMVGQPLRHVLDHLGVPAIDDSEMTQLQLSLCHGSRATAPLQIRVIGYLDENRPCQAVLLQDVSYRYLAQRRIDRLLADLRRQTARAKAADHGKSVFLASASHELRQPIHAIGLFLTALQSQTSKPMPPQREALLPTIQRMRASLDSLMELLNLLLGASLSHAAHTLQDTLRPVPLHATFDELVSQFAPAAAQKGLALYAVPSRAHVLTDPAVLRRILDPLLANAVRYTRRGRIVLGARRRGDNIEIQVWDSGIGIAPEQIDAIFQEFYRVDALPTRGGHTEGLGLSMARRSAAQLGARLDVRSIPGHGSVFSVLLPRCDPG